MRAVNQRLKVAAPTVFGVQTLPICADGGQNPFVPYYLPILEEIQVNSAAF